MENLFKDHWWIIPIILIWTFPWKGVALWIAARRGHLGWFVALLILNTLAILDILYIFIFSKWGDEHEINNEQEYEPQLQQPQPMPRSNNRPMVV